MNELINALVNFLLSLHNNLVSIWNHFRSLKERLVNNSLDLILFTKFFTRMHFLIHLQTVESSTQNAKKPKTENGYDVESEAKLNRVSIILT